jgi:hypothetical protein
LSSAKIGKYLNEEFFYYYDIYTNHRHLGAPFDGGWTEYPQWYCQLISWFDNTLELVRAHNERKAYERLKYG